MVYLIWISIGILAFLFKNNKYISALTFVFIAVIFCFNTANPDFTNYEAQYLGYAAKEPFFHLAEYVMSSAGMSYRMFRIVISLMILVPITWSIYQLTPYPTLVLFMYSIYPLTLDVTQLRFALGYAIASAGVVYLMKYQYTRSRKDAAVFIASVLIATGAHFSAILYMILGLLVLDIKKHRFFYLIVIPAAAIIGLIFREYFVSIASVFIGEHKADIWISAEKTPTVLAAGRILVSRALPMALAVLLAFAAKNQRYKDIVGSGAGSIGILDPAPAARYRSDLDPRRFYDTEVNRCMFVSMYFIYLYTLLEITISGSYERLARLGVLIGSALITRQIYYLDARNRKIALALYFAMFAVYWAFIYLVMTNSGGVYFNNVFRQVMESNSIFGVTY